MEQLYTRWGRELDTEHVLEEYPRPLMIRNNYTNLNGYWEYAITEKYAEPDPYDGKILVPFSPESALSGVSRQLRPKEYLWYRRTFEMEGWPTRHRKWRLLLHFGAVDQSCVVFINGEKAGRHTGGYLPFQIDITEYIKEGTNEIVVVVKDLSDSSFHTRGKQKLKNGGMFYTAQSGIWQTVWMEEVPADYIWNIETEPDLKEGIARITVFAAENFPVVIQLSPPALYDEIGLQVRRRLYDPDQEESKTGHPAELLGGRFYGRANEVIEIPVPDALLWTCEQPYLYYFTVRMGSDMVESYFAMRSFSLEKDQDGYSRICLNGEPQFQNGVLDQGYWPEGLYTAPSDAAMVFDLSEMKKMGFNMVRKHLKIEPQRWYYHCDRLGLVVWQDMVNGGDAYRHWLVTYLATVMSWRNIHIKDTHFRLLSRKNEAGQREFVREMKRTAFVLKNHPSIAVWVIFNEGWGQFRTEEMTEQLRESDGTRLIDQSSGWFDQGGGDLLSVHNYFFSLKKIRTEETRATVLSEFGGYSYREAEHSASEKVYGYGKCKSKDQLMKAYSERMEEVRALIPKGLCASVYTQWTDIEEEVNGIYTYDREVKKIDPEAWEQSREASIETQETPRQDIEEGEGETPGEVSDESVGETAQQKESEESVGETAQQKESEESAEESAQQENSEENAEKTLGKVFGESVGESVRQDIEEGEESAEESAQKEESEESAEESAQQEDLEENPEEKA